MKVAILGLGTVGGGTAAVLQDIESDSRESNPYSRRN